MRIIGKELKLQELKRDILQKTRDDIDAQQRNYFIKQQIKNLQAEMNEGSHSDDYITLMEKISNKNLPENVENIFLKEADKLEQMSPQSPDYNVQLNYLETVASLPWGV